MATRPARLRLSRFEQPAPRMRPGLHWLIPSLYDRNLSERRGPGGSKLEDAGFAGSGFSSSGPGISPASLHLDVCLVDPLRAVAPVQVRPDPLLSNSGA